MTMYRKRQPDAPVNAVQWNKPGDHPKVITKHLGVTGYPVPDDWQQTYAAKGSPYGAKNFIMTQQGEVEVHSGDYIIEGAFDFYPCNVKTFEATYLPA